MPDLIPCPACSKNISVEASMCPKCGKPLESGWVEEQRENLKKASEVMNIGCLVIIGIFLILAFIGSLLPEEESSRYMSPEEAGKAICRGTGEC